MNILFIIKMKIACSLSGHKVLPSSPMMLIIELKMIIKSWAQISIFVKRISFWYPLLEAHLTTYHSNIGVIMKKVNE